MLVEPREDIYRRCVDGEFDTRDIHTAVAAHVLRIPSKSVTPEQRRAAKTATYSNRGI